MRIAIEALGIHYVGGGRTATLNLLNALFALDTHNQYLVILSQPESFISPGGNVRQWVVPLRNRFALRLWAQLQLPLGLRDFDLVHFAKNLGVFGISAPKVVTIYDVTTLLYPDFFPRLDVWYWQTLEKLTLQQAARVITISQSTARDVVRFYGLPSEQIQVIYPSYSPHFRPASPDEMALVRRKYALPARYLLHVGRIDRKKNLPLLLRAFADLRARTGFEGKLVVVGEEYKKSPERVFDSTIKELNLQPDVILTGCVPDADLPAFYSAAMVTAFPSFHEGFGLMALEAMACGSPVIAHAAGALQEIAGDAAIVLNTATDVKRWSEALQTVAEDALLRRRLREAGLERAKQFTGERVATETLNLYRQLERKK
jgi:glycosyltransferase involved in cell wall biosynthesis